MVDIALMKFKKSVNRKLDKIIKEDKKLERKVSRLSEENKRLKRRPKLTPSRLTKSKALTAVPVSDKDLRRFT